MPASPNWHLSTAVNCLRLSPIDHLINGVGQKHAIVAFGEDRQIGGFYLYLSATRTSPLGIGTVARGAL